MSYLCDLLFIFVYSFIMINRIVLRKQAHLPLFFRKSYYFWMIALMKNVNSFQIAKAQPQGVA